MAKNEKRNDLKAIEQALKTFPKVVKQNAAYGKSLRKLMRAFEPITKDLARRVKKRDQSG